jgi:hypothetical protein
LGKILSERHILNREVIGVIRMSRHSLTRNFGHRSNIQDLQEDAFMDFHV